MYCALTLTYASFDKFHDTSLITCFETTCLESKQLYYVHTVLIITAAVIK